MKLIVAAVLTCLVGCASHDPRADMTAIAGEKVGLYQSKQSAQLTAQLTAQSYCERRGRWSHVIRVVEEKSPHMVEVVFHCVRKVKR
jgi:hypothetical protein